MPMHFSKHVHEGNDLEATDDESDVIKGATVALVNAILGMPSPLVRSSVLLSVVVTCLGDNPPEATEGFIDALRLSVARMNEMRDDETEPPRPH